MLKRARWRHNVHPKSDEQKLQKRNYFDPAATYLEMYTPRADIVSGQYEMSQYHFWFFNSGSYLESCDEERMRLDYMLRTVNEILSTRRQTTLR